ncbi:MAG: nuclear transport factor 2 family protein [Armatimonadetes bacterium]|nr:nuclear transport factor 2 family protein [Armatimonadota bacterium]
MNRATRHRPSRLAAEGRAAFTELLGRQVAALNRRDLDALVALYSPDAVLEFPASPVVRGREAIRSAFARFFADWEEEITLRQVAFGAAIVAAEGRVRGRHRTLHLKIPGRKAVPQRTYEHPFAAFLEIRRGLIRRHRVYYDTRDLVRQLLGGS